MGDTKVLDGLRAPRCLTPEGALAAWKVAHTPITVTPAAPPSAAQKPAAPTALSPAPNAAPAAPVSRLHAAFGLGPRRPLGF